MIVRNENRANQLPIDKEYLKGISLVDVDGAIYDYMVGTIIPDLEENGAVLKVPLVYGNAERWNTARKEGYLRDKRNKIQIPLMMFKRNSIERDSSLQFWNENLFMPAYKKYSTKNRYDKFTLLNNTRPNYELYDVSVPEYVTISYEVMIWTNFTEHMNKIVEAFQFATDRYWGNTDTFKFRTRIESFDTQQDVGEGTERIIRTTFTMAVNAYLLPEKYGKAPVTRKSLSPKKVVVGTETDVNGNLFTDTSLYGEYQNVINFIAIRGSQMAVFVDGVTVKLMNVKLPILPQELIGSFDTNTWFRVYINGVYYTADYYDYTYNSSTKEIIFAFKNLPFQIDQTWEVAITGKFIEL